MEEIDEKSFSESGIEEIAIPSSITAIRAHAFWNCKSLKNVTFQEDARPYRAGQHDANADTPGTSQALSCLEGIEGGAFHGCESLKYVRLPEGLKSLMDIARKHYFYRCHDDKHHRPADGVFRKSGLEEIILPSTL